MYLQYQTHNKTLIKTNNLDEKHPNIYTSKKVYSGYKGVVYVGVEWAGGRLKDHLLKILKIITKQNSSLPRE